VGRLAVDTLTAVMLVVVNTVSSLVHLYSIRLHGRGSEPAGGLQLPLAVYLRHADAGDISNLVQLFFGWEGVGLMTTC